MDAARGKGTGLHREQADLDRRILRDRGHRKRARARQGGGAGDKLTAVDATAHGFPPGGSAVRYGRLFGCDRLTVIQTQKVERANRAVLPTLPTIARRIVPDGWVQARTASAICPNTENTRGLR